MTERRVEDVKVLWTNLYRGVRSLVVSVVRPKESIFGYRLLTSMAKYRDTLEEVDDLTGHLLLRIKAPKEVKPSEAAHALTPITLNLVSRLVSKKPSYAIGVFVVRGLHNPRFIAASLTFNKDYAVNEVGMRPIIIILRPKASPKALKKMSKKLAKEVWSLFRKTVQSYGIRYASVLDSMLLYPPLAVVSIEIKGGTLEEIKAVVSDGSEYREVRVPVKVPEWSLEDLPPKVVEDIKVAIVNPVKKGMPFATRGAFITGPPGVGKSVMAEALASALGLRVVELRPTNYRSMWYGATEKMLNALFHQIIKKRKEVALIIDDAEFISSRKYTIHEAHISEISTILYHLQRPDRPFTILTANNPDLIDPAILRPGRIDVTVVLGYPDKKMRRKVIMKDLRMYNIKAAEDVIDEMVRVTRWYSLAEVDAFVRLAASKGNSQITSNEVAWAKKKFNISPSERQSMQDYLRWWAGKTQGIVVTYIPSENEM